jgi:transcriptional regulator with XRE-family HTH domain
MTEYDTAAISDADELGGLEDALGAVIAERVREFRHRLGWTVSRLAMESGLSKGMLSKIENMQASPSLATLARLSESLSVPVTAFFRGLSEEQDVVFVKAGSGLEIHHTGSDAGLRYQLLGSLTERTGVFPLYQHASTELIFMISGKMEYICGSTRYLLEPGHALQFVGEAMHGPGELMSLPIQFLAIKSVNSGG